MIDIRGVWISPDKTELIISAGQVLYKINPGSDEFARVVLDVPATYTTLWIKGGEAPE